MNDQSNEQLGRITTRSTSAVTADAEDIVLRETQITRLIFRPTLIGNNPKAPDALADGIFIFQKKSPKQEWIDVPAESLASLKAGEIRKLELHADELLKLTTTISALSDLVRQHGIKPGTREWIQRPQSALLRSLIESDETLKVALSDKEVGLIARVVQVLVAMPEAARDQLQALGSTELTNFSALVGAARLARFLKLYKDNETNSDESFWQGLMQKEAWVISQVFASPAVIMRGQAFVGGKSLGNTGGKLADFAVRNELTKNLSLVEIKTPATQLLDAKPYRQNVYSVTSEVSGAVSQLLSQKSSLIEEASQLQKNARLQGTDDFEVFRPRAVLVVGSLANERLAGSQLQSFELFRNELRDVEIVTFDELARKVKNLLRLLGAAQPAR